MCSDSKCKEKHTILFFQIVDPFFTECICNLFFLVISLEYSYLFVYPNYGILLRVFATP